MAKLHKRNKMILALLNAKEPLRKTEILENAGLNKKSKSNLKNLTEFLDDNLQFFNVNRKYKTWSAKRDFDSFLFYARRFLEQKKIKLEFMETLYLRECLTKNEIDQQIIFYLLFKYKFGRELEDAVLSKDSELREAFKDRFGDDIIELIELEHTQSHGELWEKMEGLRKRFKDSEYNLIIAEKEHLGLRAAIIRERKNIPVTLLDSLREIISLSPTALYSALFKESHSFKDISEIKGIIPIVNIECVKFDDPFMEEVWQPILSYLYHMLIYDLFDCPRFYMDKEIGKRVVTIRSMVSVLNAPDWDKIAQKVEKAQLRA